MSIEPTKRDVIVADYLNFVNAHARLPTLTDLHDLGYSKSAINHSFGNLTRLHQFVEDVHYETLQKLIRTQGSVFSEHNLVRLDESIAKYRRFIITTAVAGKRVNEKFLQAIRTYERRHSAKLLILPCADVASTTKKVRWGFDPLLNDDVFITRETELNSNFFISNILVSAKQIKPTTGLARIGQQNGSYIFASPKQFLEYVATSPSKDRMPKAIMTTGSITESDYDNDFYMSQRTSYIASHDHVVGALIVEIVDDKRFHFRQVQANTRGEFVDLGVRYFPNGDIRNDRTHFYGGDWHAGNTDPEVRDAVFKLFREHNVHNFFVGDFFDGHSVNHHENPYPFKRAARVDVGFASLIDEFRIGARDIAEILKHIKGSLILIQGNHDDWLQRYLMEGRYLNDYLNNRVAHELVNLMFDGKNPLEEGYKKYADVEIDWDRVVFHPRDEEYRLGDVEVGQHGDKGANGSRGSLASIEHAYRSCIVGHTHTPAIFRSVYRVGTFTKLKLDYNDGPSSWVHCGCFVYEDGARQLVNFIEGQYCLDSKEVDTVQ